MKPKRPFKSVALILCMLLFFLKINAQIPDWKWAKHPVGDGNDWVRASVCDKQGDFYITGKFTSTTLKFGSVTLHNINGGNNYGDEDIFIAKYDSSGNVVWAKSAGSYSSDESSGITVDIDGDVYIAGSFSGPEIIFENDTLRCDSLESKAFMVKYNSSGKLIWAKQSFGKGNSEALAIVTDNKKNIYLTGDYYNDTIGFDNVKFNKNDGSEDDMFLVKFDSNGTAIWGKHSQGNDDDAGWKLAIDTLDNIFVIGEFMSDSMWLDTMLLRNKKGTAQDIFIAKYNSKGDLIWGKVLDGIENNSDNANSAIIDTKGNLYICGEFRESEILFDTIKLKRHSEQDVFIVKYNNNGKALWAQNAGKDRHNAATSLAKNGYGGVFMAGAFSSSEIVFASDTLINRDGKGFGTNDLFIVNYDSNGKVLWTKKNGGNSDDGILSIATDSKNNIFVSGWLYEDTIKFGTTIISDINAQEPDIFVAKLSSNITTTAVDENKNNLNTKIYPNPAENLFTIEGENMQGINIRSMEGKLIYQSTSHSNSCRIQTENFPSGIYLVEVRSKDEVQIQKIIIQH